MKNTASFITVLLIFSLSILFYKPIPHNMTSGPVLCGVASTLDDIKNTYTGITNFVVQLKSIFSAIGVNTFFLFLAVLFLSAGLSAIGIPRGKISFLVSLTAADAVWIMWAKSFNPSSCDYLVPIIKSNAILISPFLLLFLTMKMLPKISKKSKKILRHLTKKKSGVIKISEAADMMQEIQNDFMEFQKSLLSDIKKSADSSVQISDDTSRKMKKLTGTINRFPY